MKHVFPVALDLWILPRTLTTFPASLSFSSSIFVYLIFPLSSGLLWDLLSSWSPNLSAHGSLGSLTYTSSFAPSSFFFLPSPFYYLANSLACFASALALAPPPSPPFLSFLSFFSFLPPASYPLAFASFWAPLDGAGHDPLIAWSNCPTKRYHEYAFGVYAGLGSTFFETIWE